MKFKVICDLSVANFAKVDPKFAQSVIFTPNLQRFSMKHLFSLLAAGLMISTAWTQTTVTLSVDMSNEVVSADGVHVAGNFKVGTLLPL